MKKIIVLSILFCSLLYTTAFSQSATTGSRLQVSFGNFYVPKFTGTRWNNFTIGASYTYAINRKFSITAGYTKWGERFNNEKGMGMYGYSDGYLDAATGKGVSTERRNYKMVDVLGNYALLKTRRHEIIAGAGLSYSFGTNYVRESEYPFNSTEWNCELNINSSQASYFGYTSQVGYNYFIFKGVMNIGISGATRYYPGIPLQLYTNLNAGVNF